MSNVQWNPEFFASFNCYFDYLDKNTVSFHFRDESIHIQRVGNKTQIVFENTDESSAEIKKIWKLFSNANITE